jgi:hypothetical protein
LTRPREGRTVGFLPIEQEKALLSRHDELLLRDLRLQPLWLLWGYVALGVAAAAAGFAAVGVNPGTLLCAGGGFLLALGAEKLVTRRIRRAAAAALPPARDAAT